ncbi:hypothetical protein JCM10207_003339 [Rhodosporidiobolus poonsookiae]
MSAPTFHFTTASPAHSTHSASSGDSIPVQAIHQDQAEQPQGTGAVEQGHSAMNSLGAKGFLMKKMAAAGQNFHSPTDQMVSPCTKKLAASKQRHFTKGKPLSLSSSFQAQAPSAAKKPSGLGQSSTLAQQEENANPF